MNSNNNNVDFFVNSRLKKFLNSEDSELHLKNEN